MKFTKIADKYPERHKRYVIIRDNKVFTATPCAGMHKPWWVVMTMGEFDKEAPPEDIKETDMWCPLDDFIKEVEDMAYREQRAATLKKIVDELFDENK